MVRLTTKLAGLALLAATLILAPGPANAQSATPQAAAPPQTPAPSTGPLRWSAQGNTVQPVPQPRQQPEGVPSPPGAAPAPVQQTAPVYTTGAAAPSAKPATVPASRRRSTRSSKTQVAELPPVPAAPPTLDQLPPVPPQVHYQNGELTIDAQNSTLSQVLRAVQAQTGASIDVPGTANSDRVAAKIGPGQPRDVLNTLLNGSKYNYVILGVAGDPGAVQKVMLTPRQGGPAGTATAQVNNPTPQPSESEQDEGVVAESPEPEYQGPGGEQQAPPPPGAFRRPGFPVQPPDQNNTYPPADASNGANGTKTPEQLMQELQQVQQQQQQYQEQLNPANRPVQ